MPSRLASYRATLDQHRARLDRLLDRRGAAHLKKLYDEANHEMVARLRQGVRGAQTFTRQQQRVVLAQLHQGQALISKRLAGELGDLTKEAQVEAVRGVAQSIEKLERTFRGAAVELPVEQAARLRGIVDKRRGELRALHTKSMANYGARVVQSIEKELSLSLMTGETGVSAIERIMPVIEGEWWQAERIVRTETAWAFNASHRDTIAAAAEEIPELMNRWCEHVDDDSGEPYDDRVGTDSLAMHGQVAPPGGMFTMPARTPSGEAVSDSLVGEQWAFPPNRPNDRAVVEPWHPAWGIPGWRYSAGRRIPFRLTQ